MLSDLDKEILTLTKRKSIRLKEPFVILEPLETRIVPNDFFRTAISLSTRNMLVPRGEVHLGTSTAVVVRLAFLGDLMLQHNDIHQSMKNFNLVARYCLTNLKVGTRSPEFLRLLVKYGLDSHYYVEDILRHLHTYQFINWLPPPNGVATGYFGHMEITHRGISALLTMD